MADSPNPPTSVVASSFWLKCWRGLNLLFCLTLAATFLLQCYFIFNLHSRGYIQMPQALLSLVNDRIAFRGASLAVDSLVYHPHGLLVVEGLRLGDKASARRLAHVDALTLQRNTDRQSNSQRRWLLEMQGGRLFKGDTRQAILLDKLEGRLSFYENDLVLHFLQGRHPVLTVSANGSLPHVPRPLWRQRLWQALRRDLEPVPKAPDLAASLQAIVAGLDATLVHLTQAEAAHLHFSLNTNAAAPTLLLANARLHAGRLKTLFGSMGPLVASGQLQYDLQSRDYNLHGAGYIDSVRSPQFGIRTEYLHFNWQLDPHHLPRSILNVASGQIHYGLDVIDRAVFWTGIDDLETIDSSLVVTIDRTTQLAAQAQVNLLETTADLNFMGTVDPILVLEHSLLEPLRNQLPIIEIMDNPYLSGFARFERGFAFREGSLRLRVEPLRLDDITVDYADAVIQTDGVSFKLEQALLETGPHHGYVSANYDSESGDYAVQLEGLFDPNSISSIVGSWWDSIFRPFDFSQVGAGWANFVIRGNHSQQRPKYFNGSVSAESVGFENLLIEFGHLKVRGTPTFVELFDLYALHESGGTVAGSIYWQLVPDSGTGPKVYHIHLDSKIDPAAIVPALPPAAARWAAAFSVEQAPTVRIEIQQHNPDFNPPENANRVTIEAQSNGAVQFEGIPLASLIFNYYGIGNQSFLRDTRFVLAEGEGTLSLDRWFKSEEASWLRFDFQLEDALRAKALSIVRDFLERQEQEQMPIDSPRALATSTDSDAADAIKTDPARISIQLSAKGPEANPLGFKGLGHFELHDKKLAAIPLLGPISILFEGTPLGFTSLRLNTMHGDFRLQEETVFFPKLMIQGTVGEMEAVGSYQIPDKAIDFRLYIHLFGQLIETPSFVRRLTRAINPLPGILEGTLSGTLDEPRWRSAYDPRSWLPFTQSGEK